MENMNRGRNLINEKKEEKDDNKNNESNEINTDVKYIKVITKELNIRSAASWDDDVISGTVKKVKYLQ